MSASEQLERLLYILPLAAREGGATFQELARALHCAAATVMKDIEEATSRVFFHPAGAVDPFEITIDDDRVRVHAPQEFRRPVRLNAREALTLGLGLRTLAAEAEPERRAEILALAARLENELAAPEIELHVVREKPELREAEPEYAVAMGEDDLRSVFADAIEQRRVCEIEYVKPHTAPALREVLPLRLIYANGHWYVRGIDVAINESRVFRLDRITSADLTDRTLAPTQIAEQASFYQAGEPDEAEVRVRYSPHVARWIAEQNGGQLEADGSIVIVHRVADEDWLVRHVLQYGGEAVVETPEYRRIVARKAAVLCA